MFFDISDVFSPSFETFAGNAVLFAEIIIRMFVPSNPVLIYGPILSFEIPFRDSPLLDFFIGFSFKFSGSSDSGS